MAGYDASAWDRLPVFVRDGAIMPLEVGSAVTGLGTAASAGLLTVLVWPADTESRFVLHETDGATTTISTSATTPDSGLSRVKLSRALRGVILRVRVGGPVTAVGSNGQVLTAHADRAAFDAAESGFWVDGALVWIKLRANAAEVWVETIN